MSAMQAFFAQIHTPLQDGDLYLQALAGLMQATAEQVDALRSNEGAILVRCGAMSYGIDQLVRRYRATQAQLSALPLVQPAELRVLLEDQVKPVTALFRAMGAPVEHLDLPSGVQVSVE